MTRYIVNVLQYLLSEGTSYKWACCITNAVGGATSCCNIMYIDEYLNVFLKVILIKLIKIDYLQATKQII